VKFFKVLRYVLLAFIMGLAIYHLMPHFKDFSKLWELKNNINLFWILAALISQVFQYVGDGWLSQILFKIMGLHMKMKDTIRIASLNVFAAHLLPVGEAGGVAAAYHFYRKLGVTPEKFIFLTVCWTAITHIVLFLLLFVPIFFLPALPIRIDVKLSYVIAAGLLMALTAFLSRRIIFRKLEKIFGKYHWFQHLASFLKNREKYIKLLKKHPGRVLMAFLASLIYYASNIATLSFSFLCFGTLPHLSLLVFAYAASLLSGRITLAPAGIGATEASLILIFIGAGIDTQIYLGAILVYRLISFWLPIPAGFLSFYSLKNGTSHKNILKSDL